MPGLNQAIEIVAVGEVWLVGDCKINVAIVRLPSEGINPSIFAAISKRVFGVIQAGKVGGGHFPQDAVDAFAG
jgi:hypothetical protein